jgi:hypothetical protein
MHALRHVIACAAILTVVSPARAQNLDDPARVARLTAQPAALQLTVGDSAALRITALDASGSALNVEFRFAAPRGALRVADGHVAALEVGTHEIVVTLVTTAEDPPSIRVPVTVAPPPLASVSLTADEGRLYAGTTIGHRARALHADGSERQDPQITWSSSNPAVAAVDAYGSVTAMTAGSVTIRATVEGVAGEVEYTVAAFPATRLVITGGNETVRTGDVQAFLAVAYDANGRPVNDVPMTWSHTYTPTEGMLGTSAHGQLRDGRMVADVPGIYTVLASAGPLTARRSFRVTPRDVVQKLLVQGQGRESRLRTTDLWPFEGKDGRDYALTGAKLSDGFAFVWDITDPDNIVKTDSIQVNARTINDVKVSPDSRYGVLTREGASDRRNGVIILDLANPAHPTVAATFDQELTGGVHNAFATNDYLFAVSNGDKYVIIDVRDIYNPKYVSEYDHPDSSIHDIWVHDGLAYSAEWGTGIVVVDVGNGRWGGTIENPKLVTTYVLPSGRTHAVFPYRSESTGKFYLFAGDEIMSRNGLALEGPPGSWPSKYNGSSYAQRYDPDTGGGGVPLATRGYIQVVDFTDPTQPEMVARYEVTEFGTHNIWVEDDKLFQGYYEGGLRVVDVSGELMGNLYTQGREIAAFKPFDPTGFVANSPMVWAAIPYKGRILIADTNSGLWSVKLEPRGRPVM